jgi:ribonuclease E
VTSETPDQNRTDDGAAPRRATRRRVTRPTSAPAPAPAPIVIGSRSTNDETANASAPATQPEPAMPSEPATQSEATTTSAAPARAPRRATRRTAGPSAAKSSEEPATEAAASSEPAVTGDAEPLALPTAGARPAAAPSLTLDDIVLPGGPSAGQDVVEAPRGRRRSTRTTKAAAPAEAAAVEAPAPAQAPVDESATPEAAAADAPPKGRRRASRTSAAKTSAEQGPTPADDADATPEKPARSRRSSKKPATDAQAETGEAAAAADTPQSGSAQHDTPADTAGQPAGATPRLATTAMLFQAPDLSTPRRSRRAQAPAGPPRPHDAPSATDPTPAEVAEIIDDGAEAPAEATPEAPATARTGQRPSRRSGRKQGAGRSEQPAPIAEAVSSETTAETTTSEPFELTAVDAEAVGEVEEIESELVAEGLELVELGPEDFADDGDGEDIRPRRRRRRGGRGRRGGRRADATDEDDTSADSGADTDDIDEPDADEPGEQVAEPARAHADTEGDSDDQDAGEPEDEASSSRRRRRRRRGGRGTEREVRTGRGDDEVVGLKGSTRLEAKRQRRREGRDAGRRRQIITEAEFLARREAVSRSMIVREESGRTQIAVLEDGVLTEHYVSAQAQASMVGNVYLGRVQNVLPSMEAAFIDVGKGRNAVLYAGEVNWDAAGIEGQPRRIEEALKSGDSVLVQVTKDPIGHKGARLTSQITLAGRYLVLVPGGGMTGISRKLPDNERSRLKKILREVVPDGAGVIVRTAAEGASEEELRADVERLQSQWQSISEKAGKSSTSAPSLLQGEPDMSIRVVRDIFNDDFSSLVVQGEHAWSEISTYVAELAPDLRERVTRWTETGDVFAKHRVDEQLAKGMDRKVWLPSGGSLVIDRTEAMTVVDVNTGKFTGSGGTLEETVTRNNLEAAEEIVRQLRLRDIGGIIVIDFVDMVLESNRDLVLRRLVECLGRDRTKHQVAEVTSLGLVQMTRKRVGQGLVEAFSSTCEHCKGRGFIVHEEPVERGGSAPVEADGGAKRGSSSRRKRGGKKDEQPQPEVPKLPDDESEARKAVKATLATIAAAAAHAHEHAHERDDAGA